MVAAPGGIWSPRASSSQCLLLRSDCGWFLPGAKCPGRDTRRVERCIVTPSLRITSTKRLGGREQRVDSAPHNRSYRLSSTDRPTLLGVVTDRGVLVLRIEAVLPAGHTTP